MYEASPQDHLRILPLLGMLLGINRCGRAAYLLSPLDPIKQLCSAVTRIFDAPMPIMRY